MKKNARYLPILLLFVVYFSTTCFAQEKMKVAGKQTVAYTANETIDIDDTDGHVLLISRIEGFNTSTDELKFMDGVEVEFFGFSDYVKGNGTHKTYIKMSLI